jgi:hypothetical protein
VTHPDDGSTAPGPHVQGQALGTRPPLRWRGWRPALWLAAVAGVVLEWAVTVMVALYLVLAHAGLCFAPSTAQGLRSAQLGHLALGAALTAPWLLAVLLSRYRWRVACLGLAGTVFALVLAVEALLDTPAGFSTAVCVF